MSKGTPQRNARIPDDEWLPALAKAREEGLTLTDLWRQSLRAYVTDQPQTDPQAPAQIR